MICKRICMLKLNLGKLEIKVSTLAIIIEPYYFTRSMNANQVRELQ